MAKKNGKEYLILWEKWQKLKATIQESLPQQIEDVFTHFKAAMGQQLSKDVVRFAHLGNKDEEIYLHLLKMMNVYRAIIAQAEEAQGENPEADVLLAGISEVLASRLKDFEEISSDESNPVTVEKQGIVSNANLSMAEAMDNLSAQIIKKSQENSLHWLKSAKTILITEALEECYTKYQETLRQVLTALDDLHSRTAARSCTELLQREWEEIGNIIKVQIPPLEAIAPEKAPKIYKLLTLLRELYQQTGPVVNGLQTLLGTPPFRPSPLISLEEFTKILESVKIKPNTAVNKEFRGLSNALTKQANGLFARFSTDITQTSSQMKKTISSDLLLANEIRDSFSKTLQTLPKEITPPSEEAETDILNGIKETISIKIESMGDSLGEFNAKNQEEIRAFATSKPDIPEVERNEIAQKLKEVWFATPPENAEEISTFLDNCWGSEICNPAKNKIQRQIKSNLEKIEKAAFLFKKEVLLYEVCTYEELLTHSVARLRDSAWDVAVSAATTLDDTFKTLQTILKKNNITIICPAPHEIFNAQEHEVLVAEKQEGFKKGEIVKIVTSGYKINEQVILRANIIAAR